MLRCLATTSLWRLARLGLYPTAFAALLEFILGDLAVVVCIYSLHIDHIGSRLVRRQFALATSGLAPDFLAFGVIKDSARFSLAPPSGWAGTFLHAVSLLHWLESRNELFVDARPAA